jgi:hypothetical protein
MSNAAANLQRRRSSAPLFLLILKLDKLFYMHSFPSLDTLVIKQRDKED